jgi:hypothetical protein
MTANLKSTVGSTGERRCISSDLQLSDRAEQLGE